MTVDMTAQDTIVALATPEGHGALGVVRLSGPSAWDIAARAVRDPERFAAFHPRTAHRVFLVDGDGALLDEAVALPWRGPASYTGEDLVEFIGHGGRETLRLIVERLTALGARGAEPGEFTRRAFINGKLTLDQAEAVSALIEARTSSSAKAAMRILSGGLGGKIRALQDRVVDLLSLTEISLDFVEDEIELLAPEAATERIAALRTDVDELLKQFRAGRYLRHGAVVVIAGPPNAGKSTLLNRLAGFERAIVSDTPGTTRDYIDVALDWEGLPVRLFDTAGLRETLEEVEAEGTQRARDLYARADKIVWLLSPPNYDPPPSELSGDERCLIALNKIDLSTPLPTSAQDQADLEISGRTGAGVDTLRARVAGDLLRDYDAGELLILEERHAACLTDAADALARAEKLSRDKADTELLAVELHETVNALGEITGTISSEDLLNSIFSRFCIGK